MTNCVITECDIMLVAVDNMGAVSAHYGLAIIL